MNASPESLVTGLFAVGYYLLVIFTILVLFFRKRETASIFGWALAIIFLPGAGMVLFYLIGFRRIPRRLKRKVAHHYGFSDRFADGERLIQTGNGPSLSERDPWAGIYRVAERLGAGPARDGNRITYLGTGRETFDRIFEAIKGARHHVHIQKYIFRNDRLGKALLNLLIQKASQGVEVRLIVDAVGSFGVWRLIRKLERKGGKGAVFLPVLPIPKLITPNLRNHRKIVVCDGKVGFMGGVNVGEEYLGRRRSQLEWCDAHLVILGPAVWDLQRIFLEDWDFTTGHLPMGKSYFPAFEDAGETRLQIVPSGPDQERNAARQVILATVNQSRRRLLLASPYVVPDSGLRDAILNAALRGVEVVLLTQRSPPDHWLPYWSSRFFWEEFMEAGVAIHQFQPGMMHAKVLVADGRWASVGSVNLDTRSLLLNFEVIGITEDRNLVGRIEGAFEGMLERSAPVPPDAFRKRPRLHRALEGFGQLFAPLL